MSQAQNSKDWFLTEAGQRTARLYFNSMSMAALKAMTMADEKGGPSIRTFDDDYPLFAEFFPPPETITWDANGVSQEASAAGFRRYRPYEDGLRDLVAAIPSDAEYRAAALQEAERIEKIWWVWATPPGSPLFAELTRDYYTKMADIRVDLNNDGDYTDDGEKGMGYWMSGVMAGRDIGGQAGVGDGDFVFQPVPHLEGPTLEPVRHPETNYRQSLPDHGAVMSNNYLGWDALTIEMLYYAERQLASALQVPWEYWDDKR